MSLRIVEGDVFEVDLQRKSFALVYADPPYANCRFKYARANNSRQWGRNARADFLRDIIARMESLRAPNGICAISMATPELDLLTLFPSKRRVMAWTKPYAPMRPGVWPCYAWEPLVCWGRFPNREEQRTGKTPHDWLHLAPARPKKGGHENPKPEEFGRWVISVTLGPRSGTVCELYAGTAPVGRAASELGMEAVGVDLVNWIGTPTAVDSTTRESETRTRLDRTTPPASQTHSSTKPEPPTTNELSVTPKLVVRGEEKAMRPELRQ